MDSPEQKNYAAIGRLESVLAELRSSPSALGQAEAILEVGFEMAIAIREVGAMLINVGWEQKFAADRSSTGEAPDQER